MAFTLTVTLYLAACVYMGWRICRILKCGVTRVIAGVLLALLAVSFVIGRALPYGSPLWLNRVFYLVGTEWLVVVLYFCLVLTLLDIGKRLAALRPLAPKPGHTTGRQLVGVAAVTLLTVLAGTINAFTPSVTHYRIDAPKIDGKLRIALVSDLHAGYGVRRSDIRRLVERVNELHPDLVLIAGDLVDGDMRPIFAEATLRPLENLKSTYGTVAVVGNHEFMGDVGAASFAITQQNLTLLRDSFVNIKVGSSTVHIIGREDISTEYKSMGSFHRKTVHSFGFNATDGRTIVVDHQPLNKDWMYEATHALLYLSGHTHGGQVWPVHFLTKLPYPAINYGHKVFGETNAIVTSGYGTWGPRCRIGTRSEIVLIEVN